MLPFLKTFHGFSVLGTDEKIGKLKDFLFDDSEWVVRYLVVDTGHWLPGKQVLISPVEVTHIDWTGHALAVSLKKEQVENGPDISAEEPVSRHHEEAMVNYYGWIPYWLPSPIPIDAKTIAVKVGEEEPAQTNDSADSHLRSAEEVKGYRILASDGHIGHVHDFILDLHRWVVRYIMVDPYRLLPGKKVLVSPGWVEYVDWVEQDVGVGHTCKEIKNSPVYDSEAPINRDYEALLYDYYGYSGYWNNSEKQESKEKIGHGSKPS